ncbi:PREDICTED: exocyst complex component 3-like protein 4 [Cyprinodon variegatus]|uniref:Si:dkey-45k15.1 n=1 Tax=Cyprinodon variegatus TaxID=28743 RepID=A0A3Q2GBN6_CYPVA|nr:PREDICTED: exocyst complex component 3-like protein 4 [Cyprinodon variegatus]XP_015233946.1 PREDICTED: exocyst complex component 3-like protein 4 [Cyprinodon variegatus]
MRGSECSQVMDKSSDNPEEDRVSLRSNGKMPANGMAKEVLGAFQSFRQSIRRPSEKSPFSPKSKDSKVTSSVQAQVSTESSFSSPPTSPSLSAGSPATTPFKAIGGSFQKNDEDQPDIVTQKKKPITRSKSDTNTSKLGDSLMKKGASIRRSLRFSSKKENDKTGRKDSAVSEALPEIMDDKEAEEEELSEVDELYSLPEIPHTPLSVMQINKLIEMEVLEEAHLNLLAMRQEFQKEQEQSGDDSPMELAKKEKDLVLLYNDLRKKICTIVCDSNSLPARNKALLVHLARIIQEEEKRAEEPGGLQDSWREAWREAVSDGVLAKVKSVHLDSKEQNRSWLAVHLGLLGKIIVEDLMIVKQELRWSYPPSFKVFSTYVRSYQRVLGQHLKKLESQVTELKDVYALLDWILHTYKSEKIMGSFSLLPEMAEESTDLQLEESFMKQLLEKYSLKVKDDMSAALDRVIELENKDVWKDKNEPQIEDNVFHSQFPMDIWTNMKANVIHSQKLDIELEKKVIVSCLEELKTFPTRFENQFILHCSALQPQPLWTKYQITYINSFAALQQYMEGYMDSCPNEVEAFRGEVKGLIERLMESLGKQYKDDAKPFLRRMMTRKWLTNDDDFKNLYSRTRQLCDHCEHMSPPYLEEFANRLHYHVVKEYIGQLMKNNYSCKNQKHERAATKIFQQWKQLCEVFDNMGSTHEWLDQVGYDLSKIIGEKNKTDIKSNVQPLLEHYPDFSRKHLVAVLSFRGLNKGREYHLILQKLTALKKEAGSTSTDRSQVLFEDIQVTANTDCFSNLPSFCVSFLQSDS